MLMVCLGAIFLIIAVILTTIYIISYRNKNKKKHNFGVKKFKTSSVRLHSEWRIFAYLTTLEAIPEESD